MLLSNNESNETNGYAYHGVRMRSLPLAEVPEFEEAAGKYAGMFGLPENRFNIGVDLICYRDGRDSIGWHSDDTHDETVVLCVVVESEGDRPVHLRPNERVSKLADGDEEVELFVREGDAYELDENCQRGYLHRLPKREKVCARRMCAIFRHGVAKNVGVDTGRPKDVEEYFKRGLMQRPAPESANVASSTELPLLPLLPPPLTTAADEAVALQPDRKDVKVHCADCSSDSVADGDEVDGADDHEDDQGEDGNDEREAVNETIAPSAGRQKIVFGNIASFCIVEGEWIPLRGSPECKVLLQSFFLTFTFLFKIQASATPGLSSFAPAPTIGQHFFFFSISPPSSPSFKPLLLLLILILLPFLVRS